MTHPQSFSDAEIFMSRSNDISSILNRNDNGNCPAAIITAIYLVGHLMDRLAYTSTMAVACTGRRGASRATVWSTVSHARVLVRGNAVTAVAVMGATTISNLASRSGATMDASLA